MSNDTEVELSPGFFDLNNPMNNDDDDELNNIIPDKIAPIVKILPKKKHDYE
jgi:hypothetical protein